MTCRLKLGDDYLDGIFVLFPDNSFLILVHSRLHWDSSDINLNLFQHFLSNLKLPGLSPSPEFPAALQNPSQKIFTPCAGRRLIFISSYVSWTQGTKHHLHHNYAASREIMSLKKFETRSSQDRSATQNTMTVTASNYLPLSPRPSKRGSTPQKIRI